MVINDCKSYNYNNKTRIFKFIPQIKYFYMSLKTLLKYFKYKKNLLILLDLCSINSNMICCLQFQQHGQHPLFNSC